MILAGQHDGAIYEWRQWHWIDTKIDNKAIITNIWLTFNWLPGLRFLGSSLYTYVRVVKCIYPKPGILFVKFCSGVNLVDLVAGISPALFTTARQRRLIDVT